MHFLKSISGYQSLLVWTFLSIVLCCKSEKTSSTEKVRSETSEASQFLKIYPLSESLPKDKSLMDISSILDFFQLSNLPDSLILAKINKIKYYHGQYYILDSKYANLIICNDRGEFVSQVGKLGQGPGQYQGIEDFEIDESNNRIIVLSNGDKALLFYTLTGQYVGRKKMPLFADYIFKTFNKGYAFYINHNADVEPYNLICVDSTLHITNRFFRFDPAIKDVSMMDVGGISQSMGNILHLIQDGYSDTLYRLQKDSLIPYCEFIFGPGFTRMDQVKIIKYSEFSGNKRREMSNLFNPYCESADYLSYRIHHMALFRSGFFSKNSNKTFLCDRLNARDFLEKIFSCPVGVTEDGSFVSAFDPELIYSFINDSDGHQLYNNSKFKNSRIYQVINASRDSTSPYILKYKMTF